MLTRFVIGNHEDCQEIMEFALNLFKARDMFEGILTYWVTCCDGFVCQRKVNIFQGHQVV